MGSLPNYATLSATDLCDFASFYDDQFSPGHPGHISPTEAVWTFHPAFPLERLTGHTGGIGPEAREAWIEWFFDEVEMWSEEGQPDRYTDLLTETIKVPVIAFDDGERAWLWDGNHRVGATHTLEGRTLPAIIGTKKTVRAINSQMSNLDAAVKAEAKRCVKGFHKYTSEQRATHAASNRLGYQKRVSVGEVFWTHPDLPGVCYPTRKEAATAAVSARKLPAALSLLQIK